MAKRQTAARKSARRAEPKFSRLHAPDGMPLEGWQAALRRQFGREQDFGLENLGEEPWFSDFRVTNPQSRGVYRVSIRGAGPGDNRCSCPDFASNELGTCKHIEFTLARLQQRRGAKTAFARGYRPDFSELWLQYGSERSLRLRIGGACPPALRERANALFDAVEGWRLRADAEAQVEAFIAQAAALGHELRVQDGVADFLAERRAPAQRRAELAWQYPLGAADPGLRELLRVPLFPYQAEGTLFAAAAGRALIADEMGLGKTIQAIAAAELWRRHFGAERALVVCPTSLKHQWRHELQRFAGRDALIVEGSPAERARLYAAPAGIKIVSYDSLVRDLELANAWRPDVLIVDEAQRVKNWDTRAARALKRLHSRYAVVLTGTPLENRLEELLSVVQLVDQHRLGPTWRFLHEHQLRDESGRVTGYRQLDRIGETLAPIMIRRRKREVLAQLPERRDRNLFVPLSDEQKAIHEEQAGTVARIVARWRRSKHLSDADQKRLTAALQRMRMVCNSSYLVDHETDHGNKVPELIEWLEERLSDPEAKAVIFSQWLGTHELIVRELERRGWGHVLFHGSVDSRKRGELVERFREDPDCRLFLSTDAGGTGLNLQHAALLVNMDLPWNPAVLEQRIGRVYRLGQARKVEVLNFVAEGSIEENMLGLLRFKRSLSEGALDSGAAEVKLEGTRLSRFMEGVEALTGAAAAAPSAEPAPPVAAEPAAAAEPAPIAEAPAAAADPWAPLLAMGQSLLAQLAGAAASPEASPLVQRDAQTGRQYLRLPLPEPALLRQLADAIQVLNGGGGER